jgi:hypothetical protein
MPAIWRNEGEAWKLVLPSGFPDEATLHTLIERAPHLLPLAGSPRLVVVGREVRLGAGFADLIAIEPDDGRVAIVEIKLARNSEARRAVIAQVLAYASVLHGETPEGLERILSGHLGQRGHATLADALEAQDQQGAFDRNEFRESLRASLEEGRFRLVIVLDSTPAELARVAAYLSAIADKVTIDLISVAAYEIGGSRVLVPQRVDAEHFEEAAPAKRPPAPPPKKTTPGIDAFVASIEQAQVSDRKRLARLVEWATDLQRAALVELSSFEGVNRWILLPRLQPDNAGLVTIWNENGAAIQFWRSMFEKRAPQFIDKVEARIGRKLGQGNTIREFDDELLDLLTQAYRHAATVAVAEQ